MLIVKWVGGVAVTYRDTKLIFDPQSQNGEYPLTFITHAHYDHARSFSFRNVTTYSTRETLDLVKTVRRRVVSHWKPITYTQQIVVGDLRVVAHNAGHILGSVLYEVFSPEGSLVYTGDLNFIETYTMEAAVVCPCDVLVIEATFGDPRFTFKPYNEIAVNIIEWTLETIRRKTIPAIQTDSLGNAQELVKMFNTLTTLPVVTHKSVTRINQVYEAYGYVLDYHDISSKEGDQLLSSGNCVYVAPKRGNISSERFDVAYASGFATYFKGNKKPFLLSDHADFSHLLSFIEESKPKLVLTYHGGRHNAVFSEYIKRKLGIAARPLTTMEETVIKESSQGFHEEQIKRCISKILSTVRIPGFSYTKGWIETEVQRSGSHYTKVEIDEALNRLIKQGLLSSQCTDKYELRKGG